MTIKEFKKIIDNLPEDTTILLKTNDIYDVESVHVQYHSDGRVYVILSDEE